jgi:alpha-1,2-mannosyltransferase
MSQSRSAVTPRRPTALAVRYAVALAVAVPLGLLIGWLATTWAEPDPRVIGPLLPPLAISFAFVSFAAGLVWIHRREIGAAFDLFLPPPEKALRAVVLLIATLSAYETFRLYLFHFLGFWPTDLPSYHYASLALRHGLDPYVLANLAVPDKQVVFPYVYPPLLALLWTPLTYLPIEDVSAIWQILSLVAVAASLVLCIRLAHPISAGARAAALVAALLLPLGLPSSVAAHHGAISTVFVFLLLLFFERLQRGRDRTAGVVLAIACGIKVLPVLLLPYLVLKRRWRVLIAAAAAGAFLLTVSVLIVGWRIHWEFLTQIAPQIGYAAHSSLGFDAVYYPENQSLNGFLSRLFCPGGGCGIAIAIACLAAALPVAWRVGRRREIDGAELALVSLVLLIVSPITWIHHLVLLHLPAIVLAVFVADGRWRPRAWWLAAAALVAIQVHDSGRVVIAVKGFVPWADQRLLMLLALYVAFLHIELHRTAEAEVPAGGTAGRGTAGTAVKASAAR